MKSLSPLSAEQGSLEQGPTYALLELRWWQDPYMLFWCTAALCIFLLCGGVIVFFLIKKRRSPQARIMRHLRMLHKRAMKAHTLPEQQQLYHELMLAMKWYMHIKNACHCAHECAQITDKELVIACKERMPLIEQLEQSACQVKFGQQVTSCAALMAHIEQCREQVRIQPL